MIHTRTYHVIAQNKEAAEVIALRIATGDLPNIYKTREKAEFATETSYPQIAAGKYKVFSVEIRHDGSVAETVKGIAVGIAIALVCVFAYVMTVAAHGGA